MKKITFLYMSLFLCLLSILGGGSPVVEAATGEILPPGLIIGDDTGLQVGGDGKYFVEHTDIQPGITFTKKIIISNYAQTEGTFHLQMDMKAEEDVTATFNLLEAIGVTLEMNGKILYQGDLSGKPQKGYRLPIDLGKYKTGDTREMLATFTVSTDYPTDAWKNPSKAEFYWGFIATNKEDEKPPKPKPILPIKPIIPLPQTGEEWTFLLMGVGLTLLILLVVLSFIKRHRHN